MASESMTAAGQPLETERQFAALPWRERSGVEVLLVSSRDTGRWVIPKGWPIADLMPHETAAREAFEEAGIEGGVATAPLGHYTYRKRLPGRRAVICDVQVFAFRVTHQRDDWPEKHQRRVRWFPAAEAAGLVAEPELAGLIRKFAGLA